MERQRNADRLDVLPYYAPDQRSKPAGAIEVVRAAVVMCAAGSFLLLGGMGIIGLVFLDPFFGHGAMDWALSIVISFAFVFVGMVAALAVGIRLRAVTRGPPAMASANAATDDKMDRIISIVIGIALWAISVGMVILCPPWRKYDLAPVIWTLLCGLTVFAGFVAFRRAVKKN